MMKLKLHLKNKIMDKSKVHQENIKFALDLLYASSPFLEHEDWSIQARAINYEFPILFEKYPVTAYELKELFMSEFEIEDLDKELILKNLGF